MGQKGLGVQGSFHFGKGLQGGLHVGVAGLFAQSASAVDVRSNAAAIEDGAGQVGGQIPNVVVYIEHIFQFAGGSARAGGQGDLGQPILAGAIHSPVGGEVGSLSGEYIRSTLDQLRGQAGGHGIGKRGQAGAQGDFAFGITAQQNLK